MNKSENRYELYISIVLSILLCIMNYILLTTVRKRDKAIEQLIEVLEQTEINNLELKTTNLELQTKLLTQPKPGN